MSFADTPATKYNILGRTAASEAGLRAAQANLPQSQANTNPAESAARNAANYAQSAFGQARAAAVPAETAGTVGLQNAQAGFANAGAWASRSETQDANAPDNINPALDHASGTSNIKGPAPQPGQSTDTTPAMLTPGES